MVLLIVAAVLLVIWFVVKPYFIHYDTVLAFTGGLGSGKSLVSTQYAIRLLRKNRWKVRFWNLRHPKKKKAKPLLAQIVKVLRSLYLAYVELRGKFERLQGDYGRVRESNIRLSDRLQEVKLENKAMRQVSADYERVKRAFGPEQVDRILEAAYQQEHAEKERKRAARQKTRVGAR